MQCKGIRKYCYALFGEKPNIEHQKPKLCRAGVMLGLTDIIGAREERRGAGHHCEEAEVSRAARRE